MKHPERWKMRRPRVTRAEGPGRKYTHPSPGNLATLKTIAQMFRRSTAVDRTTLKTLHTITNCQPLTEEESQSRQKEQTAVKVLLQRMARSESGRKALGVFLDEAYEYIAAVVPPINIIMILHTFILDGNSRAAQILSAISRKDLCGSHIMKRLERTHPYGICTELPNKYRPSIPDDTEGEPKQVRAWEHHHIERDMCTSQTRSTVVLGSLFKTNSSHHWVHIAHSRLREPGARHLRYQRTKQSAQHAFRVVSHFRKTRRALLRDGIYKYFPTELTLLIKGFMNTYSIQDDLLEATQSELLHLSN